MIQPRQGAAALRQDAIIAPLIVEFLQWLATEPRSYAEVMDGWRTSCPRLPIWEDAVDEGLVRRTPGRPAMVELTAEGRRRLGHSGHAPA